MHYLVFLSLFFAVRAEQYQYSLNILDKLNPDWIQSELSAPVSRIECGHLCFKQESCKYFGYNDGNCHLLKDSVDEEQCPDESCANPGMKIYKLREIAVPTTTTEAVTTTTKATTTTEATTTEEPTTEKPTTTTTEEPTTTEKPTTTEEPTTTTTAKPTTSTTQAPTTTTTESTTTTTDSPTTTTTDSPTTTTEKPTTTTTEIPTTTTEVTSTTTAGAPTSTTAEPFNCDPPDGAEAELSCPTPNLLLNALGSKSPFFGDALSPKCYDFKEILYDDKESAETKYTFFSLDGGFTINAKCEKEFDIIIKFKICVKDAHIPALTIHCHPILDKDRIDTIFNASSEVWKDALTDCDSKTGFQAMYLSDAGDTIVTRVIFQCVKFVVDDGPVDAVVNDNKPATG